MLRQSPLISKLTKPTKHYSIYWVLPNVDHEMKVNKGPLLKFSDDYFPTVYPGLGMPQRHIIECPR